MEEQPVAGERPHRTSRTQSKMMSDMQHDESVETDLSTEKHIFGAMVVIFQLFLLIIFAVWTEVKHVPEYTFLTAAEDDVALFYTFFSYVSNSFAYHRGLRSDNI
tara:strand:- start:190 stop:504 length:315 start_codon:yes stop_codon:yes gene_type:complete